MLWDDAGYWQAGLGDFLRDSTVPKDFKGMTATGLTEMNLEEVYCYSTILTQVDDFLLKLILYYYLIYKYLINKQLMLFSIRNNSINVCKYTCCSRNRTNYKINKYWKSYIFLIFYWSVNVYLQRKL